MTSLERREHVKRCGEAVGFQAVGVASLERNAHADQLDAWLAAGYGGTMEYLQRQAEKRKQPHRIMPEAKVALVTLTTYFYGTDGPGSPTPGRGPGVSPPERPAARVAQYAWSADYHRDWPFGCDLCQGVCPWNEKFAATIADPELAPGADLIAPEPATFLRIGADEFTCRYGETPFERPGPDGMRRNAAAVLANRT